jgi:hypothetical protein
MPLTLPYQQTTAGKLTDHRSRHARSVAKAATTLLVIAFAASALSAGDAAAAAPGPAWAIQSVAQPTNFSPAGGDYELIVTNVGSEKSREGVPVTISDKLPSGVQVTAVKGEGVKTRSAMTCTKVPLQCAAGEVPAGETVVVEVSGKLEEGAMAPGPLNTASVSGGGAPAVTTTEPTAFSSEPAPFGIETFSMQAYEADGSASAQAGVHPYTLATSLYFTSNESGNTVNPAAEVKDVIVDLPAGLVGNPQVLPRCPLSSLLQQTEETACQPASRIGTIVFEASPGRTFRVSEGEGSATTAVYNMQPTPGFPAEFGFTYLGKAVYMFASTVRIGGQLRLRVTVPGIPSLKTLGVTLLFFGDPGKHFGEASLSKPFFTSPVGCETGPLTATAEVDTWQDPAIHHANVYSSFAQSTTYPQLTGCNMLQFQPSLSVAPDSTQADEPSGYTFTVANPQNESPFSPGTPELKDASVTLPAGVSVSPAAADGLEGCAATGPEGINIGNGQTLGAGQPGAGQDVGDPEATELGAGHLGGNGSPYDDGLYHTAPGHCPTASTIGSVEIQTPLLPGPLTGHVYIAKPQCGGAGQAACTEADAVNGRLFGVYLEAAGSGAIVKLAGNVSVNPSTGQITSSFHENPQVPFSELRLHFNGGPRAALANPQACGAATTRAAFSAWSSPATPDSTAFPSFPVDWDGAGGACPGPVPFAPSLTTGSVSTTAGAFSPFTFTLSRADRQQYLSQLSVTTPPGLLGMLSSVTLCGEPQAAQGACPEASRIGTVNTAAGAGSHPLWVAGRVYLTKGYKGAPFGLSIVVPADAGPFHLGNVIVRSAINVDPLTSALTITSDRLPQIIDGVPLRIQTVNVTVDRRGFMFNPTNCEAKQIAVTVSGAQGAVAHLASPFAAAGCKALPFHPSFNVSTQGNGNFHGASLDVKISQISGEAAIGKVDTQLPLALPSRLTTLQKACTEKQFNTNPAGCPAGSFIGSARASTPVLNMALTGPAILVSHGGAAFPDLDIILQGEGIRIDLVGNTDIKKGITFSRFKTVPDAPISSFELYLTGGPGAVLAATRNLCALTKTITVHRHGKRVKRTVAEPLLMPTMMTGQNGAVVNQNAKIKVTGCSTAKKAKKSNKRKRPIGASGTGGRGARR